ncbi:MAG: type II toxin-antitoxin system PemK/MazF family toxin [Nanoarchaeota archaeon]
MILKKFDIVLTIFPFTNLKNAKKRPALIINPLEGENSIVCQITTKQRNFQKYGIFLPKKACRGDIRFNSFIYVDMIFTLHKSLIHGKIGEITSSEIREEINQKIRLALQ